MIRTHRNQQLCIIKHFELGPKFFFFCKQSLIPTNSCCDSVMLRMDVCCRINLLMYSKSSVCEMFWIFVVAVMLVCAGDLGTESYYGEQNYNVMLFVYIYIYICSFQSYLGHSEANISFNVFELSRSPFGLSLNGNVTSLYEGMAIRSVLIQNYLFC